MNILQVHNRYLAGLSGEDTVLDQEYVLLKDHGHEVRQLTVETTEEDVVLLTSRLRTAANSVWSMKSFRLIEQELKVRRPDLIHVHNTFPLLSPSIYAAAKQAGVPLVHTLHNYRLICANGMLMRDNRSCDDCIGKTSLSAIVHRCYKDSLPGTLCLAAIRAVHKTLHTYDRDVSKFIVQTEFAKKIFVRDGFKADSIVVKPNFLADPLAGQQALGNRNKTIVYAGRLSNEKGVDLAINAWKELSTEYRLLIIGEGPNEASLRALAMDTENIEFLGRLDRDKLLGIVGSATAFVLPSLWYEGMSMSLLESLAVGTPVIVPNLGAMPDIIDNGKAGLIFQAGDVSSLASAFKEANINMSRWKSWSNCARDIYLRCYTPAVNYSMLLDIYNSVIVQVGQPIVEATG